LIYLFENGVLLDANDDNTVIGKSNHLLSAVKAEQKYSHA
jgi:hypothetical protein